jgi:HPt (histidine-containing phosphotransfer) domain-containing protein
MSFELFSAVPEPVKRLAKDVTWSWNPPECLREFDVVADKEIVQDLIGSFVTDAAERLKSLRRAMLAGDVATLKRLAHSLKGSSAQMGAERMAELCWQIEHAADPASAEEFPKLEQLETYFRSTSCAMLAYAGYNLPPGSLLETHINSQGVVDC